MRGRSRLRARGRTRAHWRASLAALPAALALLACGAEPGRDSEAARGEKIYRNVCVVCHNSDPAQDGSLGPAVAGASRELLEAKLLRGGYPAGYTPKRSSQQMPRFEFLEPNLDDIAAYLASRSE